MLDDDGFWRSGRARGVDDIGGVARIERDGGRGRGLPRDRRPVGVEPHDAAAGCRRCCAGTGSRSSSACWVTSTAAPASASMKAEPLARIVRIERQVGGAGLQDAEQPHHHLRRALDAKPHHGLGPHARARAGDAPGGWRGRRAPHSSACGPRTPPRRRPACAPPARRTATAGRRRGARTSCAGGVEALRMVVRSAASRIARLPSGAWRRRPPPPAAGSAAAPSASTVPRSNRSAAYSSTPVSPAGSPVAERCSASATDRSNLEVAAATACGSTVSPGSVSSAARPVRRLERQHHLEQRMPRQRPRRIEHLDQPLERKLGMRIGRKVAGSAPGRSARRTSDCPTCRCAAPAC